MSDINTVQCDVCKTQRKDTNHWWKGFSDGGTIEIVSAETSTDKPDVDLCGFECASKWLGQQMQKIVGGQ